MVFYKNIRILGTKNVGGVFFMKKFLVKLFVCLSVGLFIFPSVADTISIVKADENENLAVIEESISTEKIILTEDAIIIDGRAYNQEEFEKLVQSAIFMKSKFAAAAGVYFIPGVGQIALTATGAVVIAGVTIAAGHWAWKTITNFLNAPKWSVARNYGIDHWILFSDGRVDLGKFKDKNGRTPLNKNAGTFKNGRYTVEKDTGGHGGRRWKLKKNGHRIGSLDSNGNIISK